MSESLRRQLVTTAAVFGGLAVTAGAFGAHGLASKVSPHLLEVWNTAVRYQMWHVLAALILSMTAPRWLAPRLTIAVCIAWLAGTLVFSGSLYALVLSGVNQLGAVTPFGGVALIAGWVLLAAAAIRRPKE